MDITVGYEPASGSSILSRPSRGGLVIMGAHVLCKHEVGVRSSHPPPVLGALADVVIAAV